MLECVVDVFCFLFWDVDVSKFFGGECCCVVFCCLLLEKFEMFLLDEFINYLDVELVVWLECFLYDYEGIVVVIIYDRYFFDNVVGWILELDCGEGIFWEGNYFLWLE